MQKISETDSLSLLKNYIESEDFKGWDPYDGLNSKFFQSLPIKNVRLARLAWIQFFKLSPFNFRKIFLIEKDYNSKGIGLFLNGYCQLYRINEKDNTKYGDRISILEKIDYLANLLLKIQSKGYSGACWGYNFDWQNRVFFQPKNTPTVVATSFIAHSLFEAYEITKKEVYLNTALSACEFITQDLNRTNLNRENFIFSYSPLDHSQVYNASLLGSRLLAEGYHYTKKEEWLQLSRKAVSTICNLQNQDGSWVYGAKENQQWIDSFHTGFNIECLSDYSRYTGDKSFDNNLINGLNYYIDNFFLKGEIPKYFNDKIYPIDIHSPAQLLITLIKTKKLEQHQILAEKVLQFTIKNMQNPSGYFYYQLKKGLSSKISYMRWAQAWMFYAMSHYQLAKLNIEDEKKYFNAKLH